MIIWLASYPRSGNTLLRTVLHQCLNAPSLTDERWGAHTDIARAEHFDRLDDPSIPAGIAADWPALYAHATASPRPVLIKTHQPPVDDQPFIYVVRDGRAASASYFKFHQSFHPTVGRTLPQILVGADHYGSWSDHYAMWNEGRPAVRRMVLKFEDLVRADTDFLARLADFIGTGQRPQPWVNPQAQLQRETPAFFGQGATLWSPPDFWDARMDSLFWLLHGAPMQHLGFAAPPTPAGTLTELERELARAARGQSRRACWLQTECDKRLRVIEQMTSTPTAAPTVPDGPANPRQKLKWPWSK